MGVNFTFMCNFDMLTQHFLSINSVSVKNINFLVNWSFGCSKFTILIVKFSYLIHVGHRCNSQTLSPLFMKEPVIRQIVWKYRRLITKLFITDSFKTRAFFSPSSHSSYLYIVRGATTTDCSMRKPTYSDTKENAKTKANSKGGLSESYPNAAIPYWPRFLFAFTD